MIISFLWNEVTEVWWDSEKNPRSFEGERECSTFFFQFDWMPQRKWKDAPRSSSLQLGEIFFLFLRNNFQQRKTVKLSDIDLITAWWSSFIGCRKSSHELIGTRMWCASFVALNNANLFVYCTNARTQNRQVRKAEFHLALIKSLRKILCLRVLLEEVNRCQMGITNEQTNDEYLLHLIYSIL